MIGLGSESWTRSIATTSDDTGAVDEVIETKLEYKENVAGVGGSINGAEKNAFDEKTPLLAQSNPAGTLGMRSRTQPSISKRVASALVGAFRIVISAVLAPGRYLIACFFDDQGHFSAAMPVYRIARKVSRRSRSSEIEPITGTHPTSAKPSNVAYESSEPDVSGAVSESDLDSDASRQNSSIEDGPARNTRSKVATAEESEASTSNRAPRIKIVNPDEVRRRKHKRAQGASASPSSQEPPLTVDNIKSPTSSALSSLRLTKYPRAPAPPRPLIPRRQPSYAAFNPSTISQKTLVIDLDETLIHSMARGGRMSTGHMVEVKLSSPVGHAGNVIGPQVPILYYVHKRPYCDEFLRKVSKWYNLIVFTASVQEYADPVIDWLELERKYFSARYYRQHCTYRNGAYIKDLAQVEPDLSRVMILDNSPMSYIFHEDNAIPIQGWISDPTDNDLLHLIPLFEGLQYTTDVRALLALRLGEAAS